MNFCLTNSNLVLDAIFILQLVTKKFVLLSKKPFAAAVCKFGPAGWSGRQLEILGVIIDYSYCDVRKWEKRSEPGGQQKSNQC